MMMMMMIANLLSRTEISFINPNYLAVNILLVYRANANSLLSGERAIEKETNWPSFLAN